MRDRAEKAEENAKERRRRKKSLIGLGKMNSVCYRLVDDPSPYPCVPGLGLTKWEVYSAESWVDGTRFVRVHDKLVYEYRAGELVRSAE